jgi:hypothetical protein
MFAFINLDEWWLYPSDGLPYKGQPTSIPSGGMSEERLIFRCPKFEWWFAWRPVMAYYYGRYGTGFEKRVWLRWTQKRYFGAPGVAHYNLASMADPRVKPEGVR